MLKTVTLVAFDDATGLLTRHIRVTAAVAAIYAMDPKAKFVRASSKALEAYANRRVEKFARV